MCGRLPWIIAVHKFRINFHKAGDVDLAHFAFPPHTPPGQYIIHYAWGGYRDCVDVDLLPESKPVIETVCGVWVASLVHRVAV